MLQNAVGPDWSDPRTSAGAILVAALFVRELVAPFAVVCGLLAVAAGGGA
jgi:hypothetical protein